MSRLFPRRAFLQSVLASAAGAATAAPRGRPKPKPEEPGAPFQIECGRILVETAFVTPDGGQRRALAFFNMGMGRTALAPALHAELGLDRGAPLRYSLADAAFETPADTVDVAKADFITGLSLNQMFDPMKVEAMLSPSLLRDRVLVLDYGRRRLVVAEPGKIVPEGAAAPVELNPQTGLATVTVDIAGAQHAFVIDAGSGYCWMRGQTLAEWLANAPDWRRAVGAVGAANYNMIDFGFEKQGTIARLPEITIGETTVPNIGMLGTGPLLGAFGDALIGDVFWDNWQKSAPRPVAGWLGANVLKHFRLTIDYPNRQSYWRPQSAPDPHDLDQPGVTLVRRNGRYFIGGLVHPSRGEPLEGVQVGDELLAIDGLHARVSGKGAVLAALRAPAGQSRTLTLSGAGGERKIEAPALDLS
jgi:hypothetical protein